MPDQTVVHTAVREKYGAIATAVAREACCAPVRPTADGASASQTACCGGSADPISSGLYSSAETNQVPAEAVAASLGCGNPTALVAIEAGQTVLDLGSGGGIDVLLSARRVGPTGKAYGLDMTDEMLALAKRPSICGATRPTSRPLSTRKLRASCNR